MDLRCYQKSKNISRRETIMDKIALATSKQRMIVFTEAASKLKLPPYIVEKDFWVSWVLGKMFADPFLRDILRFKGGTSLSKAYGVIERFSEDIDLILDARVVLFADEELEQKSNTRQAAFNKDVERRAEEYIQSELKANISKVLGKVCKIKGDTDDGHVLQIVYPKVFDYAYIQPMIKLEIGPLSLWDPIEERSITSFVSKTLPELKISDPVVPTIKAERTFWEKITILHHEANRPADKGPVPARYSRHYYDVFKLGHTDIKEKAFADLDLLKGVVNFKIRFYPRGWAKYEEAKPGTMKLLPPEHSMPILKDDYKKMQNMIYGDAPDWDTILAYLTDLENEINNLPQE